MAKLVGSGDGTVGSGSPAAVVSEEGSASGDVVLNETRGVLTAGLFGGGSSAVVVFEVVFEEGRASADVVVNETRGVLTAGV